jgi:trimethylamine--corrinoid protein Co-methyltransferase
MGRDFVMEMVAKAPSQFTLTLRNRDQKLTIGGKYLLFGNVSSPPNYWDIKLGGKVPGTRKMCQNLIKLSQYFNCIHFLGAIR